MKARILLITLLICHFISLITCKPNVVINEKTCDTWFPEPINKQAPQLYPYLKERFRLVDAFLYDLEYEEWIEYSKDYVLRSLNGEVLGGLEMTKLVLRSVPAIRKVFVSTLCILLAKILFFIVWKIALIHEFHTVGTYLNFQKHRYGLTFIPIVCILSLLILNSHFNTVTEIAINGLENLETGDDKSFMPIKERIENILAPITCRFKTTWQANRTARGYAKDINEFFKYTVNGTYHLPPSSNSYYQPANSTICRNFQYNVVDESNAIRSYYQGLPNLLNMVLTMENTYVNMTSENLSKALKVFAKALGSIEEFVERYHSDILQLPTESAIRGYYSAVVTVTGITVAVTCLFVTLSTMMVQMRKKWIVYLTYSAIFLMICCAVVVAVLFLAILIQIAFVILTENACLADNFKMFNASKPTVFEEHGYKYTVNYGDFLAKSTKAHSTWFSLVKNHNEYHGHNTKIPIALDGHRLWKIQGKFNETFQQFLNGAIDYRSYHKKACETATKLYQKVEKLTSETKCQETNLVNGHLDYVKTNRDNFCRPHHSIPSKELIFQRAEDYWKKNLIQNHSYGVIRRSSAVNSRGLMQVYLVFINPEMKLRPNVLEPWFGMAVLMFGMSPFIFLITIYLMCITPLLIRDIEEAEDEEVTARSMSLTISNSNSKE